MMIIHSVCLTNVYALINLHVLRAHTIVTWFGEVKAYGMAPAPYFCFGEAFGVLAVFLEV